MCSPELAAPVSHQAKSAMARHVPSPSKMDSDGSLVVVPILFDGRTECSVLLGLVIRRAARLPWPTFSARRTEVLKALGLARVHLEGRDSARRCLSMFRSRACER
jgi:hypothetical protein